MPPFCPQRFIRQIMASGLLMFATIHFCNAGDNKMFGRLDVLFWTLDNPNSPVTINENTLETQLQLDNSDYSVNSFPRISFGKEVGDDVFVEGVYFGTRGFNGTSTATGNNDLSLPGAVPLATLDFFNADSMTLTTSANIQNAELNLRYGDPEDFQFIGGFRYFGLSENLNIQSTDSDSGTSNYRIKSSSDLFGIQLGGEKVVSRGAWLARATGKAGVFGNQMQQSTFLGDFNDTVVLRNFKTNGSDVSFLGEIGASVGYLITENCSLEGGYGLLWIDNVARAGDQLDFTDAVGSGTDLRQHGGAFLHGATVSLVYRY